MQLASPSVCAVSASLGWSSFLRSTLGFYETIVTDTSLVAFTFDVIKRLPRLLPRLPQVPHNSLFRGEGWAGAKILTCAFPRFRTSSLKSCVPMDFSFVRGHQEPCATFGFSNPKGLALTVQSLPPSLREGRTSQGTGKGGSRPRGGLQPFQDGQRSKCCTLLTHAQERLAAYPRWPGTRVQNTPDPLLPFQQAPHGLSPFLPGRLHLPC